MGAVLGVGPTLSPRRMERISPAIAKGDVDVLDFSDTRDFTDQGVYDLIKALRTAPKKPGLKCLLRSIFDKVTKEIPAYDPTQLYQRDRAVKCDGCGHPRESCKCAELEAAGDEDDDPDPGNPTWN